MWRWRWGSWIILLQRIFKSFSLFCYNLKHHTQKNKKKMFNVLQTYMLSPIHIISFIKHTVIFIFQVGNVNQKAIWKEKVGVQEGENKSFRVVKFCWFSSTWSFMYKKNNTQNVTVAEIQIYILRRNNTKGVQKGRYHFFQNNIKTLFKACLKMEVKKNKGN